MEAILNAVLNWAVTQFNNAVDFARSIWLELLELLCFVKDSICDLLTGLRAKFCYSDETTSVTKTTSEFTQKVEVKTE
jgi:hypothetical protein